MQLTPITQLFLCMWIRRASECTFSHPGPWLMVVGWRLCHERHTVSGSPDRSAGLATVEMRCRLPIPRKKPDREPRLIDLALQGGGSHGAFTWGVLDRLLEEAGLRIDAISGTSAGAMNAAVLADGYVAGGADGARKALDAYWQRVSKAATFSPFQRTPMDRLAGRWSLDFSPAFIALDLMSRVFSPYDLNPQGVNPLTSDS